jgi:hypothetical protein
MGWIMHTTETEQIFTALYDFFIEDHFEIQKAYQILEKQFRSSRTLQLH